MTLLALAALAAYSTFTLVWAFTNPPTRRRA